MNFIIIIVWYLKTPRDLRVGIGVYQARVRCVQVQVRCGKTQPSVYPWQTLLTASTWSVKWVLLEPQRMWLHCIQQSVNSLHISSQCLGDVRHVKLCMFCPSCLNGGLWFSSGSFRQWGKHSQKLCHLDRKISLEVQVVIVALDLNCYYHSLIAFTCILPNTTHLFISVGASLEGYKQE